MRFFKLALGLVTVSGAFALAACGSSSSGSSSGDGGGSTTSNEGGSASTSSNNGGSTASTKHACTLASCKTPDLDCFGLVDNKGASKFDLRMSQLNVSKPSVLSTGVVATIVSSGVSPSELSCSDQIKGQATFNWLLQFDTDAKTLRTGGARPVTDPGAGYAFIHNEMIEGINVTDITYTGVNIGSDGKFAITTGTDLVVPIFVSATDTMPVLLPLKAARLTKGVVSASHNCIGKYNGDALKAGGCVTDAQNEAYVNGASLDGYITLEDADTVPIATLKESLCVLLGGDNDGNTTEKKCVRDANNKITYKGDWCSTTNTAGGCQDSVSLAADFAAASVTITN